MATRSIDSIAPPAPPPEAKASLLLSTLTNLSFYLLLRTEGGAVRTHPVVAQLVWLRSLHEKLGPVDAKVQHLISPWDSGASGFRMRNASRGTLDTR